MKIYSFDIFKCRVTITIEKRKYETIDRLETAKEFVKSQPGEIKMEEPYANLIAVWFSDYCNAYIDTHEGVFAKSTLDGYRNIVDHHLQGLMSCVTLDVCESIIQDAFDREIEKGLSKKTLKGYKSFVLKVIDEYYDPSFKPEIRIEKEIAE